VSEREPTPDELLAMAYADGELGPQARASFEARLAREPALCSEVAALRALELLARQSAPPEPLELGRLAIEREPASRALSAVGWTLVAAGALCAAAVCSYGLWTCGLPLPAKLGLSALALGGALLAVRAWRVRAKTLHLDPYRHVKR
jgi:anti-sigma factor RsiW